MPSPFQAIQATFRTEEIVNNSHCMMKEGEGRQITTVDAFHMVEKSNQNLKAKLIKAEFERKMLSLPWITLRSKPKANECFFEMLRINWSPLRNKSSP